MEIKVEASMKVEDGKHTGRIIELEQRTEPYSYLDLKIEIDKTEGRTLKVGYPAKITPESKLGILLANFGADVSTPGTIINPEKYLKGKSCMLMTMTKPGKNGKEYSNIIPESVKPL